MQELRRLNAEANDKVMALEEDLLTSQILQIPCLPCLNLAVMLGTRSVQHKETFQPLKQMMFSQYSL